MQINEFMVFGQVPTKEALPNFTELFYTHNPDFVANPIDEILEESWDAILSFHNFAAENKREYWYGTKINTIFTKGGSRYSFWHGLGELDLKEGLGVSHIFRVANAFKKDKLRRIEISLPIILGQDDIELLKTKYPARSRATISTDMFGTTIYIEY